MLLDWRARLNRANAHHTHQLEIVLRREFRRLLKEIDLKDEGKAVAAHAGRLNVILAAHKRAAAATFGFLALEMLRNNAPLTGAKSENVQDNAPLTRSEQVAAVLLELARTVAVGAVAALIAEALARDRALVAATEGAILAAADPAPRAIAASLLQNRHVASRLSQAHAIVTGADVLAAVGENAPSANPGANTGRSGGGGGQTPPNNPISGGPGDIPPPRRSRFSELVEQIVREESPQRARAIARTSRGTIARLLARAAREGWGEERTRAELEAALGGRIAAYRARVIARTELGSAQNAATMAMARDRAAAGAKLEKQWVAIDDARTRETHDAADDQVRALEEPFAVGKALLMHPGDPTAPLGEIIACRCAMLIRRAAA